MSRDLYTEWLGIPPGERPPNHYDLLGVMAFCNDIPTIEKAARERMDRLDKFVLHPDRRKRDMVQQMMNEVARARVCLVNAEQKRAYDEALSKKIGPPLTLRDLPEVEILTFDPDRDKPQRPKKRLL